MVVLPGPKDCKPLDPGTFEAIYRLATNVDEETLEENSSEQLHLREKNKKNVIYFEKIPLNRAIKAIEDRFQERGDFHCAALRFWAFLRLLSRKELSRWVKTNPADANIVEIHPAVFYVAATINLDESGDYSISHFLEELEGFEQDHPD